MREYITILDYAILPVVLLLVYGAAYAFRNKYYRPGHPYRKYFIPALHLKIGGALFIGILYQYYYGGGDTFNFFTHSQIINSAFADSPEKWLNLLFGTVDETSLGYYEYIRRMYWYNDPSSYTVAAIAAFISLFFGTTYLPAAVIFAVIAFSGAWAMFRAFAQVYPKNLSQVTVAVLYIPSVVIWGSGIFKDTICLASLGWLTYAVFRMLVQKDFSARNILITALAFYITYKVKVYILMAFIPALAMWILFLYTNAIRSLALKIFINLGVAALVAGIIYFGMLRLGNEILGRYSLENITETAEVTRDWISQQSGDEGSAYDLGEIGSPGQMVAKLPAAINVTLFRPYLWESRKLIVFISAFESFLFLLLTLKLLFVVGPGKIWTTIISDPTVQFCLIFALIFAFAVGISTYNFGALSRYKIPCLPFYAMFILITFYKNTQGKYLFRPLKI